ncbi:MAG TPA: PD-(D/E)XK nuclease family protein [Pseudomonadales bacterium]
MPLRLDRMAELDAALAAGALLLVPNYRSSDQLVDQLCLHRQQTQAGIGNVFRKPPIRAIDLWFTELWNELAQLHGADVLQWRVLQPMEEQLLWQQVIESESPELVLLNRDGTASTVAEAWRLLQQWQLPLGELRRHLSVGNDPAHRDDREYAWQWLQAFEQQCRQRQLLTFSGMLVQLLQFIADGTLSRLRLLPPALLRAGFDAPPPLYSALFASLQAQGVELGDWHFTAAAPLRMLQTCGEPADECRAAAEWAQAILQADPQASIGVLTSDSQLLKGDLERCFAQTFTAAPHLFSTMQAGALTDAPYVHSALASLSLLQEDIDTLELCALLRSPWLLAADGEEGEQDARAELELRVRRTQALQVRSVQLREWCMQQDKPWHCPQLGGALLVLQQRALRQPPRQSLQAWLQFFIASWDLLLPRATLLQSGDRALVKAWETLLRQVQLSSTLLGMHDFTSATALLARMARAGTLATANTQARIQLLTPVMAAGLHFTHLWCMQMTEALWPGEQQPNPYLPLNLQREHGLPGADRSRHLQATRELLQGLVDRTTQQVVFSHALTSDDLPQRCTGLLQDPLHRDTRDANTGRGGLHPALADFGTTALDVAADVTTVPLPDTQPAFGGSNVLASQSACPFKGFAQHRLQARELPRPVYGLPLHALGECIHEALQIFWQGMQSHAALVASGEAALEQAVGNAVAPALQRLSRLYPGVLTPVLLRLERKRLTTLLLNWLDIERARGPFTVIATEQELLWSLPRLQLKLRLDRIDRHADGSTVIVDYKTGRSTTTRWEDPRPAAPQLLLYQLAVDAERRHAETGALLYARINVEEPGYDGIAHDGSVYPGLSFAEQKSVTQPDWPSLKQYWQRVVTQLADEFLQGYAAVQPARRDSCTYCHLGSLCRIAELRTADTAEEAR